MFLFSVIVDIKSDLLLINELAKSPRNQLRVVHKELAEVLQLHSDSKQCVIPFLLDSVVKIENIEFKIACSFSSGLSTISRELFVQCFLHCLFGR